jgi:predicted nucleic acid-binding Zn ribbon protein
VSPDPSDRSTSPASSKDSEPDDPRTDGERPPAQEGAPHDATGLDLARSVARSLARSLARPGARRGTSTGSASKFRPPTRRTDTQASGAHPDERDPQPLDASIGRLIDDQGWDTDVRVHGVFSRWQVLVGTDVARHCGPEAFDDGRLVVRTDSTAWATQMRLLAPTVVRRLNEELGDGTVTLIEVLGPRGPTWKRGPRSVRDGRGPRDTYG